MDAGSCGAALRWPELWPSAAWRSSGQYVHATIRFFGHGPLASICAAREAIRQMKPMQKRGRLRSRQRAEASLPFMQGSTLESGPEGRLPSPIGKPRPGGLLAPFCDALLEVGLRRGGRSSGGAAFPLIHERSPLQPPAKRQRGIVCRRTGISRLDVTAEARDIESPSEPLGRPRRRRPSHRRCRQRGRNRTERRRGRERIAGLKPFLLRLFRASPAPAQHEGAAYEGKQAYPGRTGDRQHIIAARRGLAAAGWLGSARRGLRDRRTRRSPIIHARRRRDDWRRARNRGGRGRRSLGRCACRTNIRRSARRSPRRLRRRGGRCRSRGSRAHGLGRSGGRIRQVGNGHAG